MDQVIDYTYLPWENQNVCGVICWICLAVGALWALASVIVKNSKLGYDLHVGDFWYVQAYGWALIVNTAMFAMFFWYAAAAIGALFSTVCISSARAGQQKAFIDEKNGKWGLCPALRQVRGELFADLPIEQQLEHKKTLERSFSKMKIIPFYLITLGLPFAVMLVLYFCSAGYIFVPHAL